MLTEEEQKEVMRRVAKITARAVRAGAAIERDRQINKPRDPSRMKSTEQARGDLRDYLKEIG